MISIGAELERLALLGVECANARDYAHESEPGRELASHVSPDFVATVDSYADFKLTWEQLSGMWKLMHDLDPTGSCFFDVKSISSDVDDGLGRAAVYVEIAASHARGADGKDVTMHAMCELKWKRDQYGWWWYHRFQAMMGMLGDSGTV